MIKHDLARYDIYKDSEIEWLGVIPVGWVVKRLKDFASIVRGGSPRPAGDLRFYEGDIPFLKVGDLTSNEQIYLEKYTHTIKVAGLANTRLVKSGTLLLTNSGATLGIPKICTFSTTFNDGIAAFIGLKKVDRRFLFYFLKNSTRWYLNQASLGQGQPNLNTDIIGNTFFVYPSIPEQQAIADYLNTKTAQIDRKIDLLTQKATRYGELKQSLINETVTHGLDKTVEMKDSGVEWIGEVPEHWHHKRVKDLFVESKRKSVSGEETLLSVSEYSGVTRKKDNIEEDELLTNATTLVGYKICNVGELVINIMLAWKRGLGVSSFFGIVSPSYAVYSPCKLVCSAYFHYLFRSDRAIVEFKRNSTGIIESRLRLYTDSFYALEVAFPEFEEQKAIADYLDTKTAHIDRIVETINIQIDKLKELRKTLINDVVTGKIKVTGKGEAV